MICDMVSKYKMYGWWYIVIEREIFTCRLCIHTKAHKVNKYINNVIGCVVGRMLIVYMCKLYVKVIGSRYPMMLLSSLFFVDLVTFESV